MGTSASQTPNTIVDESPRLCRSESPPPLPPRPPPRPGPWGGRRRSGGSKSVAGSLIHAFSWWGRRSFLVAAPLRSMRAARRLSRPRLDRRWPGLYSDTFQAVMSQGGSMKRVRLLPAIATLSMLFGLGGAAHTQEAPATEKATFAMGCFWCAETAFEGLPGVVSVTSGYTGGSKKDPTYEEVSAGKTGHAESIQVVYDPKKVSYAQLLEIFWHNIDPTQAEGQFCDHGHQYRSAIFYQDATQKQLAEDSKHRIETTPQRFKGKIVTEI